MTEFDYKKKQFTIMEAYEESFSLMLRLVKKSDKCEQIFTGVYKPNKRRLRPTF